LSELKESMREGETVLSQVMATAVHSALSPHVLFSSLYQRPFLEQCCANVTSTCEALRELRAIMSAADTAFLATISGATAERLREMTALLQHTWRARNSALRPSLLQKVAWVNSAQPKLPPLLPLRHFVIGCAGADTATVHICASLPLPPVALDRRKSWSLSLLCEALSMMEGPLSTAVRGKGFAYGASVGFAKQENSLTLDLWECTNVKKGIEVALEVVREAVNGESLTDFQLDNARGSLVFHMKSARSTPIKAFGAAVGAATRGWRSAQEVQDWENTLGSVTRDDVIAMHSEYLMRLCNPEYTIACVVCDPGDCKNKAKGLASSLGVEPKSVRIKENISECYSIVDQCVRATLDGM